MTADVRRLGTLVETVHAVVYFAPEPQAAYQQLGLRGFWRGYFASRAAALGEVGPELVTALFGGFAPQMVARAIPQVWTVTSAAQVLAARQSAATAALSRLLTGLESQIVAAGEITRRCVQQLPLAGRPMAAAHSAAPRPDDPLGGLWHDCTVLREFRGDGHLAAVLAAGLRWPEPHVLQGTKVDPRQQEYRGWDDASWERAVTRVRGRDLTTVEVTTDQLAAPSYEALLEPDLSILHQALTVLALRCSAAIPYPNAMGLVRPEQPA